MKETFQHWLKQKSLSDSSIKKYTIQAPNRIVKELGIYLYDIKTIPELSQLLQDVKVLEAAMPKDPKRMYSSAVSNYIQFLSIENDRKNTYEDFYYESIVEEAYASLPLDSAVTKGPQKPANLLSQSKTRYERNPIIGAQAIQSANFRCQVDARHQFFLSKRTQQNYVEAHHFIPIVYQGLFSFGIDTVENIATLCPVCHRQIHYATDSQRKELLDFLYPLFETRLYQTGIECTKKELYNLYELTTL